MPKERRSFEKHRRFIASLPCAVTLLEGNTQCAHIRHQNGGGMGLKPHDRNCVPLSCAQHAKQGETGEVIFWGDSLDDAKKLAHSLWDYSCDYAEGMRLVREFNDKFKWKRFGQ